MPQPTAWAVLSGHLEAANYTLRPSHALLGQRIGIWGEPLDPAWWLIELDGVKLPRDGQALSPHCQRQGWLGTAELVGYVLKQAGKVTGTERGDGETTALRTRKGVHGPVAWILRRPKWDDETKGAKRIRAHLWETSAYRTSVLEYAKLHGVSGFADHHQQILIEMGYRAPQKEPAECPSASRIESTS